MELIIRLTIYKVKSGKTNEQIAREVGLSVFLISRLLNKKPKRIHAATRIVIQNYLDKVGVNGHEKSKR